MSLTDQQIIDNTHFREEDGKLICYTALPGGGKFEQAVSSKESVTKNMISWCDTVREYEKALENEKEATRRPERPSEPRKMDMKGMVLGHFDSLQEQIDDLGKKIEDLKTQRTELRNERDELKPIITVWRGE